MLTRLCRRQWRAVCSLLIASGSSSLDRTTRAWRWPPLLLPSVASVAQHCLSLDHDYQRNRQRLQYAAHCSISFELFITLSSGAPRISKCLSDFGRVVDRSRSCPAPAWATFSDRWVIFVPVWRQIVLNQWVRFIGVYFMQMRNMLSLCMARWLVQWHTAKGTTWSTITAVSLRWPCLTVSRSVHSDPSLISSQVWLDEYKDVFYDSSPSVKLAPCVCLPDWYICRPCSNNSACICDHDHVSTLLFPFPFYFRGRYGDVSKRIEFRREHQCKPFKWSERHKSTTQPHMAVHSSQKSYIHHIISVLLSGVLLSRYLKKFFPNKPIPDDEHSVGRGFIKNTANNNGMEYCFDNKAKDENLAEVGLYPVCLEIFVV